MTVIGVERPPASLRLHSCPSCGRHSWWSAGQEVDRGEVLAALQVTRERPAARAPEAGAPDDPTVLVAPDRRTELQRLLDGFTVHGSSS